MTGVDAAGDVTLRRVNHGTPPTSAIEAELVRAAQSYMRARRRARLFAPVMVLASTAIASLPFSQAGASASYLDLLWVSGTLLATYVGFGNYWHERGRRDTALNAYYSIARLLPSPVSSPDQLLLTTPTPHANRTTTAS